LWSGDSAAYSPEGNVHCLVHHFTVMKKPASVRLPLRHPPGPASS
jgi:hypothetical protein